MKLRQLQRSRSLPPDVCLAFILWRVLCEEQSTWFTKVYVVFRVPDQSEHVHCLFQKRYQKLRNCVHSLKKEIT